jgi:hypothetical protein
VESWETFIYHTIERIVKDNQDIKVWNLSLGSEKSISPNFISPIAALLDSLQSTYDVIFIIAGTNQPKQGYEPFIGSPADSINSLVVNATTWGGRIPSYARSGPALSFFTKPDVCANGGDEITKLKVYGGPYDTKGYGTSFAAPWITRKMAFLIQKMGLRRETAKALIIDAASGWTPIDTKTRGEKGFGEVPVRIEDVIQSRKEEIKFVITGQSEWYETYSLGIPVPRYKDKYPFFVKTTFCYLPHCSRNQGVDYTDSELDFHFGRVDSKGAIKSINDNTQDNEEFQNIPESKARKDFCKWDNVKIITEKIPKRKILRTTYGQNDWGIDIKAHERKDKRTEPLPFSVIVTLKEMNNVNRYDEFVRYAQLKHWIVQSIDITHLLHIYEEAEEKVKFEETKE